MIKSYFARPVTLTLGKVSLRATPKQLGAAAYVGDAVKRARIVRPGANVPLKVAAPLPRIERYVAALARRFDRAPVDSELSLRDGKPFVTKEQVGRAPPPAGRRCAQSSAASRPTPVTPIALRNDALAPETTRASIGDVIVIRRGSNRLNLYDGHEAAPDVRRRHRPVAYPTPLGTFQIVVKWRNPWWYPPQSDWAADAEADPARPGQPARHALDGHLGAGRRHPRHARSRLDRLLRLARLHPHADPEAEWLFNQVDVGTPVFIVR